MSKHRTPYVVATDKDGNDVTYVRASLIMHPLVAMHDGLPVVTFNEEPNELMIPIDDALKWVRQECADYGGRGERADKLRQIADAIEKAKEMIAQGKVRE